MRRLTKWVFLALLAIYLPMTRGHFWSTDEVGMYHQTRSLWEHGNLAVAPNLLDSRPGRGGQYFVPWGAGQAVLALPLYGLGKAVDRLLSRPSTRAWRETFAGPIVGDLPDRRWGGDVEIFFVNLFNCFAVAALGAVFFRFSVALGASPGWALTATLLMALTSHVAGFSTGFYQHPTEALLVLSTFYFLFRDSQEPRARTRWLAGCAAGLLAVVRVQASMLLPVLGAYLLWQAWKRTRADAPPQQRQAEAALESIPFALPAAAGILLACAVNYIKFGGFSLSGSYAVLNPFDGSLPTSLYAYLLSPGESIFWFSPLLLLAPWYLPAFARRYRAETAVLAASLTVTVLVYGKLHFWHGQWYFGPRFLMHLVPLLLLPLGPWLERTSRAVRPAVGALALAGALIEAIHIAVNTGYVYGLEGYSTFTPPFGFLFVPQFSQIPSHFRALLAWDYRVDPWLVTVARVMGRDRALLLGILLLWFLTWSLRGLWRSYREL